MAVSRYRIRIDKKVVNLKVDLHMHRHRRSSRLARSIAILSMLCLAETHVFAARSPDTKNMDEASLRDRAHFEEAGVAFDYPAALRVMRDEDGHPWWTLTRGDFKLDVYAPPHIGVGALDVLVERYGDDRHEVERVRGEPVLWCGREFQPVHIRLTVFGNRREMRGYDLPAPAGETRFLIFDDVLVNGKRSKTAEVTFAAVAATLRCSATSEPTL